MPRTFRYARRDARGHRHVGKRVRDHRIDAEAFLNQVVDAGNRGAATRQYHQVDVVERTGRVEELDRAVDLLGHRLFERIKDLGDVVVWQTALALGHAGLFHLQGSREYRVDLRDHIPPCRDLPQDFVFRFTDLPESAQQKLMFRKNLRSQWQAVPNPLGAEEGLF